MSAADAKLRERTRVLYFARHGETDWNAEGRLQGHTDIPLNAKGCEQAIALGARLRGAGITSVGSSDLARARRTAEIVAGELGVEVVLVDPAFRERAYGIFEGLTHAECRGRDPDLWARFDAAIATPPGGETLEAVTERMVAAALRASRAMAAPALIISHGRAIRDLAQAVLRVPVPTIPNGGGYRVVVEDGRFTSAEPIEVALREVAET